MFKRIEADGAVPVGDANPSSSREPRRTTVDGLSKNVLVAEDNVVSQQVAKRYLEAIGCTVMVVADGQAAVDACAIQQFGLVLMDLQMPNMDGLQATQEIRRREGSGRHVPILALTAGSASDDLSRCTAAGMNGLLTKPLDIARLQQTLDRFGLSQKTAAVPRQSPTDSTNNAGDPVDLMTLLAKFAGDTVFVKRLCQTFATSTGQALEEIDAAVAAGERSRLRGLAHKIKGGGTSVYAHRLAGIAANIESQAMTGELSDLSAAVETLRRAFDEATLHIGARLP